ncbi:MAG: hypothetical protein BWY70_00851 [Bacteroidetes bacterium ADurb.Bin408]|nr:MAG: hypothetical protein BWY70_00851 [Bacteroidetes bacterium ADurb.Bin408]
MELSKKDKKTAREIINKGLQIEYCTGLLEFDGILQHWKSNSLSDRDAYMQLYDSVIKFDKHITRRYNDLRGSNYLMIVASLLIDSIITEADLENFSDDAKQAVLRWASLDKEYK